jgi:hypothetical protein
MLKQIYAQSRPHRIAGEAQDLVVAMGLNESAVQLIE